jgi:probable HAF family extracellular repeat protein
LVTEPTPIPILPVDINRSGVVLGVTAGGEVATLDAKGVHDLGFAAQPAAINDLGDIVGTMNGQGFLWHDGSVTALPPRYGDSASRAADINDAGVVVGTSTSPHGDRAVAWHDGRPVTLCSRACAAWSEATAISPTGDIVGNRQYAIDFGFYDEEGFLWHDGSITRLQGIQHAYAINARGTVAGNTFCPIGQCPPGPPSDPSVANPHWPPDVTAALLWRDGRLTGIGAEAGDMAPTGINALGHVVGYSDPNFTPYTTAFFWSRGTGIISLPSLPDLPYCAASAINVRGQIVGECDDSLPGTRSGVIWQASTAVPR